MPWSETSPMDERVQFVADVQEQMGHAFAGTAPQLQPALFGHRLLAVVVRGLGEEPEDRLGLFRRERRKGLDGAGDAGVCDVVAGHGYEGKGRYGQSGGKEATRM